MKSVKGGYIAYVPYDGGEAGVSKPVGFCKKPVPPDMSELVYAPYSKAG